MLKDYRYDGAQVLRLAELSTGAGAHADEKKELKAKTAEYIEKLAGLQERLYADGH